MMVVISLKRFRKTAVPIVEAVLTTAVLGYVILRVVQYITA